MGNRLTKAVSAEQPACVKPEITVQQKSYVGFANKTSK
jgi:hypothetical protein